MDWLQFTSAVIGSLAWALGVIVAGFMFKEQVKALLSKVKHAKGAGIEVDFAEDVRKVAAEAVEVKAELPTLKALSEDKTKRGFRRVDVLDRPSALILTAWAQVENALLEFIAVRGVFVPPAETDSVFAWIGAVAKERVLPARIVAMIGELHDLRNRVAHVQDWEPSRLDALKYLEAAEAVLTSMKTIQGYGANGKQIVFGHDFKKESPSA